MYGYSIHTGCFAHIILLELIMWIVFVDKYRSHESRHYAVSSSNLLPCPS